MRSKWHPSRWNASAGWSRYDDFVAAHLHAMHHSNATSWAHNGPAFFPWHRELLYWFEQELQALPGYADVTIPYWDWTRDRTATDPGWPFTYDFLHGNGDVADQKKVKRDPAHATEVPYPHGFDPETWTIRVTDASADPTFLQRNFGGRADATTLPNNGRVASASTYPASVNAAPDPSAKR